MRVVSAIETTVQDIRYAMHTLRKSPTFRLTAGLTLALGIAANTAILGVMEAVTLRALPYKDPQPLGRGILVRTLVPATMMRAAGLRSCEERLDDEVKADILIGEEGLPRAIRFVVVSNDVLPVDRKDILQ